MRYWWVNQNQTYRQEVDGGYLWSPKRKSNDGRNPFYEFMREVAPGDVIFSFADTRIAALGVARSYCSESPKPTEFGKTGANWGPTGWKISVSFRELKNSIRPKDHIARLRSHLPGKYAPLRPSGDGLQNVYLTAVNRELATVLLNLIGNEAQQVAETGLAVAQAERENPSPDPTLEQWERGVETHIEADGKIPETERRALIQARRGQGLFRSNVQSIEHECRITRVSRPEHLIASHVKPWRDSTNDERLDGENGLLLTPTVDHLFDKGFISFENDGILIVSPVADPISLQRMGIVTNKQVSVGRFSEQQRRFLEYHRENILRMSNVRGE